MYLIEHQSRPQGLLLVTSDGQILLTPHSETVIRVRYTLKDDFSTEPSLLIVPQRGVIAPAELTEDEHSLWYSTAAITVQVSKQTCALTYLDATGAAVLREAAAGGKTLTPVEVLLPVFDESIRIESASFGADGVRSRVEPIGHAADRTAFQAKLEFDWAADEALYGLGSHEEGFMNLRGSRQYLYQAGLKAVVPVLVSSRGYGVLVDSSSLMTFHDDADGSFLWSDCVPELDYYFVYGPEMDDVVAGLRRLTGPTPMLPRWAFGYLQSKERYVDQAELLSVVQEYRARELPLDGIILDWQYWREGEWGQKSFDPARFPDPDAMMDAIHSMGAHLMISVWPTMNPGGPNFNEFMESGLMLANQATYDAFSRAARDLYWKQANEGLFAHGIDAWWCDCTEPFDEADGAGPVRPGMEKRLAMNTDEAKRYLDPAQLNAYSLVHSQGIYEGQRRATADKRVVNLNRSSYAGQHRYATVTWSGDTSATWDTLRKQIPSGLNFTITGEPYWTCDIGAFFVIQRPEYWFCAGNYDEGLADQAYRELYVRWFQLGTFLPMFRSHGTDVPREIWRFGDPGDATYETLADFLRLRYRMLPYTYSVAASVTRHDSTMMRALVFDFRHDPATFDISDQFMFGPAFLVCPVTESMYFAPGSLPIDVPRRRSVYLPVGSDWHSFWTGDIYQGGQTIEVDAGLETMPLFVRSGSIVPLAAADVQHSEELSDAGLELRVYPGQDGSFELYEDEGDGYGYEDGAFSTIGLVWEDLTRTLTIGERVGTYPGMAGRRAFSVRLSGGAPQSVEYDGHRTTIAL